MREERLQKIICGKAVKKMKISNPLDLSAIWKLLLIKFLNFYVTDVLCKAVNLLLLRLMRTDAIGARMKIMIDAFAGS